MFSPLLQNSRVASRATAERNACQHQYWHQDPFQKQCQNIMAAARLAAEKTSFQESVPSGGSPSPVLHLAEHDLHPSQRLSSLTGFPRDVLPGIQGFIPLFFLESLNQSALWPRPASSHCSFDKLVSRMPAPASRLTSHTVIKVLIRRLSASATACGIGNMLPYVLPIRWPRWSPGRRFSSANCSRCSAP